MKAAHLAALREIAAGIAADIAEYTAPRGTPTWDDHRVGRMLARDPVLAASLPALLDEIIVLRKALKQACAGWRAEARTSDNVAMIATLESLAGGA